jgi:hypothetical protein
LKTVDDPPFRIDLHHLIVMNLVQVIQFCSSDDIPLQIDPNAPALPELGLQQTFPGGTQLYEMCLI